jgi:hypothetical protein
MLFFTKLAAWLIPASKKRRGDRPHPVKLFSSVGEQTLYESGRPWPYNQQDRYGHRLVTAGGRNNAKACLIKMLIQSIDMVVICCFYSDFNRC